MKKEFNKFIKIRGGFDKGKLGANLKEGLIKKFAFNIVGLIILSGGVDKEVCF